MATSESTAASTHRGGSTRTGGSRRWPGSRTGLPSRAGPSPARSSSRTSTRGPPCCGCRRPRASVWFKANAAARRTRCRCSTPSARGAPTACWCRSPPTRNGAGCCCPTAGRRCGRRRAGHTDSPTGSRCWWSTPSCSGCSPRAPRRWWRSACPTCVRARCPRTWPTCWPTRTRCSCDKPDGLSAAELAGLRADQDRFARVVRPARRHRCRARRCSTTTCTTRTSSCRTTAAVPTASSTGATPRSRTRSRRCWSPCAWWPTSAGAGRRCTRAAPAARRLPRAVDRRARPGHAGRGRAGWRC